MHVWNVKMWEHNVSWWVVSSPLLRFHPLAKLILGGLWKGFEHYSSICTSHLEQFHAPHTLVVAWRLTQLMKVSSASLQSMSMHLARDLMTMYFLTFNHLIDLKPEKPRDNNTKTFHNFFLIAFFVIACEIWKLPWKIALWK